RMPWTASHYFDWPEGGMMMDKDNIVQYQISLWDRLMKKRGMLATINHTAPVHDKTSLLIHAHESPVVELAGSAIESGVITIPSKSNEDGSVEIQQPIINHVYKLQSLIRQFFADYLW